MNERELVIAFRDARSKLDAAKEAEAAASAEYNKAELALLEHLEAAQATSTATYEGLGYVKMQKPRLYASVTQENLPEFLSFLKAEGREDLLKTTVAPQTLSAFVSERIEQGLGVPSMVSYYLKTSLRNYGD